MTLPRCDVPVDTRRPQSLHENEWLVTNALGGYASGTVSGSVTRRYHGVLVAALPNPLGRTVLLNALQDFLEVEQLREFAVVAGIPVWHYVVGSSVISKRIVMPHRQNTTVIQYRLESGPPVSLRLSPAVHFRGYEAAVSDPNVFAEPVRYSGTLTLHPEWEIGEYVCAENNQDYDELFEEK